MKSVDPTAAGPEVLRNNGGGRDSSHRRPKEAAARADASGDHLPSSLWTQTPRRTAFERLASGPDLEAAALDNTSAKVVWRLSKACDRLWNADCDWSGDSESFVARRDPLTCSARAVRPEQQA